MIQKNIVILFASLMISMVSANAAQPLFKWSVPLPVTALNTKEDDFAPVWNRFQSLLFFNSNITHNSQFYTSKRIDSVTFSAPALLEGDINKSGDNQSYITFLSADNALFSSFRMTDARSYMNVFTAVRKKNSWLRLSPPKELEFDNFAAQATVSPDGSVMVFATDMNSDFGDTDLWMALRQDNGSWGALTCISSLKSPGNEITPFLLSTDTLYFATDGQEGPGGFDIFISVRTEGIWQRPEPLSALNTEFDESDLQILPDGAAIFASNRPGGAGKLDLYLSRRIPFIQEINLRRDVDLSIASQLPSIKTSVNLEYTLFGSLNFLQISYYAKPTGKLDSDLLTPNLDTLTYHILDIIGNRLKSSTALLTIKSATKEKAEEVKNLLIRTFNLESDRITTTAESDIDNDFVYFASDNLTLLAPIGAGTASFEILPPVIELALDARPRGIIQKWDCNWFLNETRIAKCAEGTEFPGACRILLKDLTSRLFSADSIMIELTGKDSLNYQYRTELALPIIHLTDRVRKQAMIGGKPFDEYILAIPGTTARAILPEINPKAKRVIIEYFENTPLAKRKAEELSALIGKYTGNKIKTEITYKAPEKYTKTTSFKQSAVFRVFIGE